MIWRGILGAAIGIRVCPPYPDSTRQGCEEKGGWPEASRVYGPHRHDGG